MTSLIAICVCPRGKNRESLLHLPSISLLVLTETTRNAKDALPFTVLPLFTPLLRLFDLQQTNISYLVSQPLFRLFFISCTLPRCWQLASRQPLLPDYILRYQTVVIILLHKDLKRKLLYVSAVLCIFLPFPSFLGSSHKTRVQVLDEKESLLPSWPSRSGVNVLHAAKWSLLTNSEPRCIYLDNLG